MEFTDKSLSQAKPPSKTAIYCHLTILTPGIYSKQVIIIITIMPKYPIWLTYISNRVELKAILSYIELELAWALHETVSQGNKTDSTQHHTEPNLWLHWSRPHRKRSHE